MPSENVEDYLGCIYQLSAERSPVKTSEIASKLGVSPASVTEMIGRLAEEGLVNYEKYHGVTLTEKGIKEGRRIKRKHRVLERFLVDVLGIKRDKIHEEANRLEHGISDESVSKICQLLNNPRTCPDGDPIPECEDDCRECEGGPSIPLPSLFEGDEAVITHLKCQSPNKIRRLISMGFVPGRRLKLEEEVPAGGPLLIALDGMRIALGAEYASLVQVRRCAA